MKAILAGLFLGLVLTLSVSSSAYGFASVGVLNSNDAGRWGRDFVMERNHFRGSWRDGDEWEGFLCNGYYSFDTGVSGDTHSIDFDLRENGDININAELRDVFFGAEGTYRSEASACIPLSGWTGVSTEWVTVRGVVSLGQELNLTDLTVRVQSTRVGPLDFGVPVPGFFEQFLRDNVNAALRAVWASSVGDWLSDKIADLIRQRVPRP